MPPRHRPRRAPTNAQSADDRGERLRARPAIRSLDASLIREVANAAMGRADVLPFWFGEPDSVTPAFIRRAGRRALAAGDTFYHHNLGTPTLRDALSRYLARMGTPVDPARIAVTNSGVNALMLAAQALVGPDERVVAVVPLWPNLTQIPTILGGRVERVALRFDDRRGQGPGWRLDLDELLDALTPDTRVLLLNTPNNPTGWTASDDELAAILAHCRRQGIWIVSDEAYDRIVFTGRARAPSMLDHASPEDRLWVANTFSKSWQMTGWRIGWLVAPLAAMPDLAKLVEFNTSCAPGFVQQAATVALDQGEPSVARFVNRLRVRRDALVDALAATPGVELDRPPGAMYVFFRMRGVDDSLAFAKRLLAESGVGLAPGAAFGSEGEGFLRWCFARPIAELRDAAARFRRLAQRHASAQADRK